MLLLSMRGTDVMATIPWLFLFIWLLAMRNL
jgi:hypothetical protein